uniref:Helicase C-terminal domain-containing protein n=1 Tax=Eutreptiella gymnastica TaxID=73025 RepID=A0A7S1NRP8_9EUGL
MTESTLVKAHNVLQIFMLRRLKSEVMKLPSKKEVDLYVPLSELQQKLYCHIMRSSRKALEALNMKSLRWAIIQLRKVANHPAMLKTNARGCLPAADDHTESLAVSSSHKCDASLRDQVHQASATSTADCPMVYSSGKMIVLDKLLTQLCNQQAKVLLFCQYTTMLDILEEYCTWKGYRYLRLDGSTKRVMREVDMLAFNSAESPHFLYLISTRAGGVGINLVSANTVIFFDHDWNPHVDMQATDRAHRIGQVREVTVYRLVSQRTVDEAILSRASKKMLLDDKIMQDRALEAMDCEMSPESDPLGPRPNGACSPDGDGPEAQLGVDEAVELIKYGALGIAKTNTNAIKDLDVQALVLRSQQYKASGTTPDDRQVTDAEARAIFDYYSDDEDADTEERERLSTELRIDTRNGLLPLQRLQEIASKRAAYEGKATGKRQSKPTSSYLAEMMGQAPKRRAAAVKKLSEDWCFVCQDGGEMVCCTHCPKVYHTQCVELEEIPKGTWLCPWHFCRECDASLSAAGDVLFRCTHCPLAYCWDCWPSHVHQDRRYARVDGSKVLENLKNLGVDWSKNSVFFTCPDCQAQHAWRRAQEVQRRNRECAILMAQRAVAQAQAQAVMAMQPSKQRLQNAQAPVPIVLQLHSRPASLPPQPLSPDGPIDVDAPV